nr:nucleic acid-binding, OB-fold-like protein [Tanacetum cinerariifolium]
MFFVWDGTDAPPLTVNSDLEAEFGSPLALQLESSPLKRDDLCKFPSVGTVLRIIVEQSNAKLAFTYSRLVNGSSLGILVLQIIPVYGVEFCMQNLRIMMNG